MRIQRAVYSLIMIMAATLSMMIGFAFGAREDPASNEPGHRFVNATIARISGGAVFFNTQEDTLRDFSLKTLTQSEKIENPTVGDNLVLELNNGNSIIRIDRFENGPAAEANAYLSVKGRVESFDPVKRQVTLQLSDGSVNTYKLISPASIKMEVIPMGAVVSMDIDRRNSLVKDFELER